MRRRIASASAVLLLVTVSMLAQQDRPGIPAENQQRIDEAHVDLLKANQDKAVEAGRLTEAVAGSLQQAGLGTGPVVRRNYIDEHIFDRMQRDAVPHAPLATDDEFVRRVYVDATGLLPTPE